MKGLTLSRKNADFTVKQNQPYEFKVNYAETKAVEFVRECDKRGLNYHVSVGGLDSITLFLFLKSIGINAPGISTSKLEDRSIQKVHKELGIIDVGNSTDKNGKKWTKTRVLQEFGFPVLSKEKAVQIESLQNPTEKNKVTRNTVLTGVNGEGILAPRTKLAKKWLKLFGGLENPSYQCAPFKVSDKCCYYMKERPLETWARVNNSVPFMGLMASEGGRREKFLKLNGCNYFGVRSVRSAPFAIFTRQDLLTLALELKVPVPEIYGEIIKDENGLLKTTKAERTGCNMCGFGIHIEKRPHRFDLLFDQNPKEWEYWMYRCVKGENGEVYGWSRVLDYINTEWRR